MIKCDSEVYEEAMPSPYTWIMFSVGAAICQGVSYFLLSYIFGTHGLSGLGLIGPGTVVLVIVAKCVKMLVDHVKQNGRICGHMRPCELAKFALPAFQTGVQIATMYMIALAWIYAFKGGLNQGVVTTLGGFFMVYQLLIDFALFGSRLQTS